MVLIIIDGILNFSLLQTGYMVCELRQRTWLRRLQNLQKKLARKSHFTLADRQSLQRYQFTMWYRAHGSVQTYDVTQAKMLGKIGDGRRIFCKVDHPEQSFTARNRFRNHRTLGFWHQSIGFPPVNGGLRFRRNDHP
jgi:hypothetical protein